MNRRNAEAFGRVHVFMAVEALAAVAAFADVHGLPLAADQAGEDMIEYLGTFAFCQGAVREAKRRGYQTATGCASCTPECHPTRETWPI